MMRHPSLQFVAGCLLALLSARLAAADGGALRARQQDGGFQISVFTSPNPLVAPEVEVSVLVQDGETMAPVPGAEVHVTIAPRERPYGALQLPATSAAATNKLFRDCHVALEPGDYRVEVACADGERTGRVQFPLTVAPPPAQIASLWPWFTWPVVPISLFGIHLALSRKRTARRL